MSHDQESRPVMLSRAELRARASTLAAGLRAAPAGRGGVAQGSEHRGLAAELRQSFVELRSALFQRGVYDPILGRFDSATVAQASNEEIAGQLEAVAAAL